MIADVATTGTSQSETYEPCVSKITQVAFSVQIRSVDLIEDDLRKLIDIVILSSFVHLRINKIVVFGN